MIEGYYEFIKDGKIERIVKNDFLYKGIRWLFSALANNLVGEGYPANATKYLHYGHSDIENDPDHYHLLDFVGSLGQLSTYVWADDNHIRFDLTYVTGADPVYINELAIGVSASDPSSSTDYTNAVLERAVISPAYIIPPSSTRTIRYNVKIRVE